MDSLNLIPTPVTESQKVWDLRFLDMAKLVASWSKDPSTQCGAVITDVRRNVIGVGYNGFPRNMPDDSKLYANRDEKYPRIIHCEVNALNAVLDRLALIDATLYTWPCISCDRCFVQMVNVDITRYVAPQVTEDMESRWGPALARVRGYMAEINEERSKKGLKLLSMMEYPGLHH